MNLVVWWASSFEPRPFDPSTVLRVVSSEVEIRLRSRSPQASSLEPLYEFDEAAGSDERDPVIIGLREQAYESADLDTVVRIRALAEQGVLG